MAVIYDQYSNAKPFFADQAVPTGTVGIDADRLRAYDLYEEMYWNHPEVYKLLQRGEDEQPIYLPSAKSIVEATNRFLAVKFDYVISPNYGVDTDRIMLNELFTKLFRRERFWSRFNNQKRMGLIRGDAIWHVTADPNKPQGTRISIKDVHPRRYFPITDLSDPDKIIGVHLVDETFDPRDPTNQLKRVSRRQTYRKDMVTNVITSELALFELGKWDDRNLKPSEIKLIQVLVPPFQLDPRITAIPVYHIKNTDADFFGASSLRGIETVLAAVSQGASDSALAWAIGGLGQYWTNAAPPVDATGQSTAWSLGPLRVAEVPFGREFGRIGGVDNSDSAVNFVEFLDRQAQAGAAVPDIAAGKVDVSVAASGIALSLHLAPILASNAEKEASMLGVYDQMFYDLSTRWLDVYEQFSAGITCEVASIVGDPMPVNRDAVVAEVLNLYNAGLITIQIAQDKLAEIGYTFPQGSATAVVDEARALAEARNPDPFLNRARAELEALVPQTAPAGGPNSPSLPASNGSVIGV